MASQSKVVISVSYFNSRGQETARANRDDICTIVTKPKNGAQALEACEKFAKSLTKNGKRKF